MYRLLEKIGLSCDTVYKHVPDACYICGHTEFANLSLLGICKKPVFYECDECGALHLRYKQDWIEGQFHNLTDSFTNPSGPGLTYVTSTPFVSNSLATLIIAGCSYELVIR